MSAPENDPTLDIALAFRRRGLVAVFVGGLAVALAAWVIAQPYFLLPQIRDAARKGDRDALAGLVDFPSLRENIRATMNAYIAKSTQENLQDNPFAGLGMLLAGAMVDRIVDTYVTPSGIAMLTQGQTPDPEQAHVAPDSPPELKIRQGYKSTSVFHVQVQVDTSRSETITFVLRRRGLSWHLTDIRPSSELVGGPWVMTPEGPVQLGPASDGDLPEFGEYVYVEELPKAITKVSPIYPDAAREAGVDGVVLVQALVGRDGHVKDTRVVRSVPMLDDAAITAVKQWQFKPAVANNKPVAVWVAVPVRFTLQ